jgi:xylose dehydrogenase (NAD/NADP)
VAACREYPDLEVTVDESTVQFDIPNPNQMTELFEYFAEAVLTDLDSTAQGRSGLVDLRTIAAIHAAAESEQRVEID